MRTAVLPFVSSLATRNLRKTDRARPSSRLYAEPSVTHTKSKRAHFHFLLADVAAELGEAQRARTHREIAARLHVTQHWPAAKVAGDPKSR
jgi:hypothetical protein